MKMYRARRLARHLRPRYYPNCKKPCERIAIQLFRRPKLVLIVETGIPYKNEIARPYVKFSFNVQRLLCNDVARQAFHTAMLDLLPSGGYQDLSEDGNVLYAEFAADFTNLAIADFDAYSPEMKEGEWFKSQASQQPETIYLIDGKKTRKHAITIYQKSRQEWEVLRHHRRRVVLRVESKRRFNHTPETQKIRLAKLSGIANPFEGLGIYDRAQLMEIFKSARDRNFIDEAMRFGIQSTFTGMREGNDKDRRLRMLARCHVDWWNPEEVWNGREDAISEVLHL